MSKSTENTFHTGNNGVFDVRISGFDYIEKINFWNHTNVNSHSWRLYWNREEGAFLEEDGKKTALTPYTVTDPSATAAAPVEILSALFSPDLFRALAAAVRACDANRQSGYLAKETVTISVGFRYDLISGCSVIDLTHPHHPFAVY